MTWPDEAGVLQNLWSVRPRTPRRHGLAHVRRTGILGAFPDRADALRIYGSGAASDGAAQASEAGNLGNYRSSTEQASLALFGAMTNISVGRLGEGNSPGTGVIESDGAGLLRWTAPGSWIPGPWVAVGSGSTVWLEDGLYADAGIRVTLSGTMPSASTVNFKLLEIFNGYFGLDDVSHAERAAGLNEYRAYFLKNCGPKAVNLRIYLSNFGTQRDVDTGGYSAAGAIDLPVDGSLADWPTEGFVRNEYTGETLYYYGRAIAAPWELYVTAAGRDVWSEVGGGAEGTAGDSLYPVPGLRLALEEPSAPLGGYIQTIASVSTAPTGVTWQCPAHEGDNSALEKDALGSGAQVGLWLHRKVVAGATASPSVWNRFCVDVVL